jgi:hypothetical protein
MTRGEKIKAHVFPLVGKQKWAGFNPANVGSVLSLQFKLSKHTNTNNKEKVKQYLALCVQEWPDLRSCPIDQRLIEQAIDVL